MHCWFLLSSNKCATASGKKSLHVIQNIHHECNINISIHDQSKILTFFYYTKSANKSVAVVYLKPGLVLCMVVCLQSTVFSWPRCRKNLPDTTALLVRVNILLVVVDFHQTCFHNGLIHRLKLILLLKVLFLKFT